VQKHLARYTTARIEAYPPTNDVGNATRRERTPNHYLAQETSIAEEPERVARDVFIAEHHRSGFDAHRKP